jgi:hypothetical protein
VPGMDIQRSYLGEWSCETVGGHSSASG